MKRTCNGCRAVSFGTGCIDCELRYAHDNQKGIPLENCPKPVTVTKLVYWEMNKEEMLQMYPKGESK